jgi:hypothetical protein
MPDRPRKRPRDFSQAAKLVIDIATGQVEEKDEPKKGRGGGLKGGKARAAALTPEQRADIARGAS